MLATPSAGKAPTKPTSERPNLNNGYLQANALEELSSTAVSPLLGQQQPLPAQQQLPQPQQQQQQHKLPTVVFLSPDGSGAVGSALQRNAPAPAAATAPTTAPATTPAVASDWLLLKEAQHRRRLLVLAIAFTVLGAAIGALAIYFASVHQQCQLYQRNGPQDAGEPKRNEQFASIQTGSTGNQRRIRWQRRATTESAQDSKCEYAKTKGEGDRVMQVYDEVGIP